MEHSNRLEPCFSNVQKKWIDPNTTLYYGFDSRTGEYSIFRSQQEILLYEDLSSHKDFCVNGQFSPYLPTDFLTLTDPYIFPIYWSYHDRSIMGLYSVKTGSYVLPINDYRYYRIYSFFQKDVYLLVHQDATICTLYFLEDGGTLLDTVSFPDFSFFGFCGYHAASNLVAICNEKGEKILYSWKKKKQISLFGIHTFKEAIHFDPLGMRISIKGQMGYVSYDGTSLIPLGNERLERETYDPDNMVRKVATIKDKNYIGLYTIDNQCIVPTECKRLRFLDLSHQLVLTEYDNLSLGVYSVELRKRIVPACTGIRFEKAGIIEAIKYMVIEGEGAHDDSSIEYVGWLHKPVSHTIRVKAKYRYLLCSDYYSYTGELLKENVLTELTSSSILSFR